MLTWLIFAGPVTCLFYPLQCDIIILTSVKITQAFHLLLDICINGKLFFNPGISIFRISVYLQMNLELNLNLNIQYIRFSSNFVHTFYSWQKLLIGYEYTKDGVLYMAFTTNKGILWLQ